MGRLIDADAFKEKVGTDTTLRKTICEIIDKQPTAYDVENVVMEIRSNAETMATAKLPHTYYKAIGTKKVEEIIRAGGVNNGTERDT